MVVVYSNESRIYSTCRTIAFAQTRQSSTMPPWKCMSNQECRSLQHFASRSNTILTTTTILLLAYALLLWQRMQGLSLNGLTSFLSPSVRDQHTTSQRTAAPWEIDLNKKRLKVTYTNFTGGLLPIGSMTPPPQASLVIFSSLPHQWTTRI